MGRHFGSLDQFSGDKTAVLSGPVAMVLVEDAVEVDTTLRHVQHSGFKSVLAFMPKAFDLPRDLSDSVWRIDFDMSQASATQTVVNAVIRKAPGLWMFYCYNAEYLFFPFCETRSIGEMLAFHGEERRSAMLTYVIDLYARDLDQHPNAVSLETACLDRSGYYALTRNGTDGPMDRQLDFFGGLRWRFEEHVPAAKRKIDRIALFKAKPGLVLRDTHTFNDEEFNTFACKWHHNLTAALCSFRTAKALKTNPGSTFDIRTYHWHNSAAFEWHSRQLLDLGLMEPGQWF